MKITNRVIGSPQTGGGDAGESTAQLPHLEDRSPIAGCHKVVVHRHRLDRLAVAGHHRVLQVPRRQLRQNQLRDGKTRVPRLEKSGEFGNGDRPIQRRINTTADDVLDVRQIRPDHEPVRLQHRPEASEKFRRWHRELVLELLSPESARAFMPNVTGRRSAGHLFRRRSDHHERLAIRCFQGVLQLAVDGVEVPEMRLGALAAARAKKLHDFTADRLPFRDDRIDDLNQLVELPREVFLNRAGQSGLLRAVRCQFLDIFQCVLKRRHDSRELAVDLLADHEPLPSDLGDAE